MLPGVTIEIQNGALGQTTQTDDGLAGLILQGPAPSGLALAEVKQITSLEAAEALGIDADYDSDNSVNAYKVIKEFYDEAGTAAKLYIVVFSQALSLENLLDKTNPYATALLDAADGKIRLLGIARSPAAGYAADTTDNEIDVDVINAYVKAKALREEYISQYKPFRVVLEARSYTGDAGALVDIKTQDANVCGTLLGDSASGEGACIGVLLGRLASDPVMRSPARVKSGALQLTEAYIGTDAFADAEGDIETIHDKGFITLRKHVGKAGYYFTDDPTATASTDDFNSLARGRVIDKVIYIAYSTFVDEVKDELEVDPDTGLIEVAKAKYLQQLIENAIDTAMTAGGEISGISTTFDTTQNILSTGKYCIELRVTPIAYGDEICIKLGFDNAAL